MTALAVVPLPQSVTETGESWRLDSDVTITATGPDGLVAPVAELLETYLRGPGVNVRRTSQTGASGIRIVLTHNGSGDESYRLTTGSAGCVIAAGSPAGVGHGIQTLRQLLPAAWLDAAAPRGTAEVPGVVIEDAPAYEWRGALLDPARHIIPVEHVRRFIDAMALHRLNRLHFHLTDDQGWRLPVPSRPRLTGIGARRAQSQRSLDESDLDGTPHAGAYTRAELTDLVACAEARGIVIIPEIDLPGHTTAALAAYPELGNTDVSGPHGVSCVWGVHDTVLNLDPATQGFCEDVLAETLAIFPSPWIHIGGDECPTTEWERSAAARARCRAFGIEGVEWAQAFVTTRLTDGLRERGRRAVVWDEAADDDLARDVIVMAWRHRRFGLGAAARGQDVVMTPCDATYFDWDQSDAAGEPPAQPGVTTLATAYGYAPRSAEAPREVRERIIGAQGALWGEYLPTTERLDDMAFPRLSALAERAWREQPTTNADFTHRARVQLERLAVLGIRGRTLPGA